MASVGDLWLVDFGEPYPGEPAFHRPALIVGPPASFSSGFPLVLVVPLTSTVRGLNLHVEIEPSRENGLSETSAAQCELLRSINRARLLHRMGVLEMVSLQEVDDIVRVLLDH